MTNAVQEVPKQAGEQEVAPAETVTPNPPPETSEQAAKVPPLSPEYKRLKELDGLLDKGQGNIAKSQEKYQEVLRKFAKLCHDLWQAEKAQGSRKEKGFRRALKQAGIKGGRAYRAMKKFFPADFPAKPKPTGTSSAANKVGGQQPTIKFTGTILECVFPFTADEKAEFIENLSLIGEEKAKRVFAGAVKQAAEAMRGQQDDPASTHPTVATGVAA
jgi:hypothetical protein